MWQFHEWQEIGDRALAERLAKAPPHAAGVLLDDADYSRVRVKSKRVNDPTVAAHIARQEQVRGCCE